MITIAEKEERRISRSCQRGWDSRHARCKGHMTIGIGHWVKCNCWCHNVLMTLYDMENEIRSNLQLEYLED